jgi:hypothetical protein
MGEVEEEIIRGAPELGLGNTGDRGVGYAVKKFPGEPDRFHGFLFGFEYVAVVVHDGAAVKIRHGTYLHSE